MSKTKQETINAEVQRILDRDGKVVARVLLDENKPKTAPLHRALEWHRPDRDCAHAHRLRLARGIIRVAVVRVADSDVKEHLVHVANAEPAARDTASGPAGHYKPPTALTVDEYALALQEAQRSLEAAQRRVRALEAVASQSADGDDDIRARIATALAAVQTAQSALDVRH